MPSSTNSTLLFANDILNKTIVGSLGIVVVSVGIGMLIEHFTVNATKTLMFFAFTAATSLGVFFTSALVNGLFVLPFIIRK